MAHAQEEQIKQIEAFMTKAEEFKTAKEYVKAVAEYTKGFPIADQIKNPRINILLLHEIADVHWAAEKYEDAKLTYLKSLSLFETTEWPEKKMLCLANLGKLYLFLDKDSIKAESFFIKGNKEASLVPDTSIMLYCIDNLANILSAKKQFGQARNYKKLSIDYYNQWKNEEKVALMYWNIAEYDEAEKNYDNAILNYNKAYEIYLKLLNKDNALSTMIGVGDNQSKAGNHKDAIESYKKALEIAFSIENIAQQGFLYWNIAYENDLLKNYSDVITNYEKASIAYLGQNKQKSAGTIQNNIALAHIGVGNYTLAIEAYKKAISLRKEVGEEALVASTLNDLAGIYWKQKDYNNARNCYLEAEKIHLKLKDKEGEIYALVNLGSINSFFDNNFAQSEAYFVQALKLTQEQKNESMMAFCYEKLADLKERNGKLNFSIENKEKAIVIYRKLGDKTKIAYLLLSLGNSMTQKGRFVEGMNYYEQGKKLGEEIPDNEVVAAAYLAIAWNESVINGEYKKAMESLSKSMQLYKNAGNEYGIADVYHLMSNSQITYGEYQEAEKNLHKADSIYALMNSELLRADIFNTKGRLYYYMQDFQKSYENHKAGYDVRVKLNDKSESFSVASTNVGECLLCLKRFDEAMPYLQNSLTMCQQREDKRGIASALEMLGEIKLNKKNYVEADTLLNKAVKILREMKSQERLASTNRLRAELYYATKQYDKANTCAEEVVQISERIGSDFHLWEALYILGMTHKDQGKLLKSKTYLKSSVDVIERIRKQIIGGEAAQKLFSSNDTRIKVYENLVDVLLKLGEVHEGMEYMERNNADEMNARFKNIKINYESEQKNKIQEESKVRQARVEGIEKQISLEKSKPSEEQDKEKLKQLESIKNVASSDYVSFVRKNIHADADKYIDMRLNRNKIPKDMVMVSYLLGENQLYIFVASRDSAIARIVPVSANEVRKTVSLIRNQIKQKQGTVVNSLDTASSQAKRNETFVSGKQQDDLLKTLEKAYGYLIAPIEEAIKTKRTLAIMPSDKLHFLPFQLLGKTLANGKFNFMVENFTIFYTKDFKMLNRETDSEAHEIKIVAFGNPDETLPAAEEEIQLIKKNFPNTQLYLRKEATEDKAKNLGTEYNIAHFATHGNLDYAKPELSYLTMAKNLAKGEDGNLSLSDLWGLDLMNNLNLVILSACNSAMSSDAEVPISPATGFFDNGVKAVIASLWAVSDEATSLLMADFYQNIKKMPVGEAFKMAQVNLTKNPKYHHPYYWAPFILQGDWK